MTKLVYESVINQIYIEEERESKIKRARDGEYPSRLFRLFAVFYLLTFLPPFSGLTFKVFYKWRLLFPASVVAEFHCVIGNARENREV